jgi:membrane protease YdiL (CAAX protease family)
MSKDFEDSTSFSNHQQKLLPTLVLFACALYRFLAPTSSRRRSISIFWEFAVSVGAWILLLPEASIVPWWGPVAHYFSTQWPRTNLGSYLPTKLRHGGPLGQGCSKIVEVIVAMFLWRLVYSEWPQIQLGPIPKGTVFLVVGILSVVVNGVLSLWSSRVLNTSGGIQHGGVKTLVQSTLQRSLTIYEHVQILGVALLNAVCEELSSRFFWRREYERYLSSNMANVAQASAFGIWHFYGIPSGWTGAGLTFVYGGIMGMLNDYGGGLLLPIVAHTIADYYIFAIIARRTNQSSEKRGEKSS